VRLLRQRLGYGTVGGLLAWLAVIAAFIASFIFMAWAVSPD
jgi:hypothetical protein